MINCFSVVTFYRFIQMKKNLEKFVGQPKLCQCRIEMGPILGQTFNWLCDDIMGNVLPMKIFWGIAHA